MQQLPEKGDISWTLPQAYGSCRLRNLVECRAPGQSGTDHFLLTPIRQVELSLILRGSDRDGRIS